MYFMSPNSRPSIHILVNNSNTQVNVHKVIAFNIYRLIKPCWRYRLVIFNLENCICFRFKTVWPTTSKAKPVTFPVFLFLLEKKYQHSHFAWITFAAQREGNIMRCRSWLRHCATSRKVAGSIPDEVFGFLIEARLPAALWPWGLLSLW